MELIKHNGRRYLITEGAAYWLAGCGDLMTCPVLADGTPDTHYGVQNCVLDCDEFADELDAYVVRAFLENAP